MEIDVTLVSGRRPDLLERTLASFDQNLFRNFSIRNFIANIDPFAGDDSAHASCRETINRFFPNATLIEPKQASFGMAVKKTWSTSSAGIVLHLEDDWVLEEPVHPEQVGAKLVADVKALQLASMEMGLTDATLFMQRSKRIRFLGIPVGRKVVNIFGTSPGFWEGSLARAAAVLIDPALDPEKQMRPPYNHRLFTLLNQYRCGVLRASTGGPLITDIGREWRDQRNLIKTVKDGVSVWHSS